jgi:hypothetical protein
MSDRALQSAQDNIRIPLYDTEGFRVDQLGLDQNLVNCFAEVVRNPTTGDGEVVVTKRNGIQHVTTIDFTTHFTGTADTQYPIANYCVTNLVDVYVCAYVDGTNIRIIQYRPQAGTTALLGTITSTGTFYDHVHFSHGWTGDRDAPDITLTINFQDGQGTVNKAYTCKTTAGVFTAASIAQITNIKSPWGAGYLTKGPIVQYNNQWYVATADGRVFNTRNTLPNFSYVSEADIVTVGPNFQSWNDLANFIGSEFPEKYEGVILYKHHLVAYGNSSIQFFTDEGEDLSAGGSPLLPTDQALIRFGVLSDRHMINVDDILYWIAYSRDNTVGLWRLDGYTPVKISTKKQDIEFGRAFSTSYDGAVLRSNIFPILIGHKKHIGISNIYPVYSSTYVDSDLENLTSTDTQQQSIFDSRGNILLYSLEDKTWWSIWTGQDTNAFFTVTSFGDPKSSVYNIDPYTQYILKAPGSFGQVSGTYSHGFLYAIPTGVLSVYYDTVVDGADPSEEYWIQSTIQTNGIEFQNLKRKRINRATIVLGNSYAPDNIAPNNTWSIVLTYGRTNTLDPMNNPQVSRKIDCPNTAFRYYVNNLGMARHLNFCITEKSPYPVSYKYLELDLAQGTG